MYFRHADVIWSEYPSLRALAAVIRGVSKTRLNVDELERLADRTRRRQQVAKESDMPEIAAWREVFSRMGAKPTQYRCAAEALLRRFRKEGELPRLHPLIDYLNHVSMAYAIPIAVFDTSRIAEGITVRPASGTEQYETFKGEIEHPGEGEVIFADAAGYAHSRRWTFRQSARSAVSQDTDSALIVVEAHHVGAEESLEAMAAEVTKGLEAIDVRLEATSSLTADQPTFEFQA